jgi:hypothetical protein
MRSSPTTARTRHGRLTKLTPISKAITFNQGNVFSNNIYIGTWNFTVLDTGHLISPSTWKAAPYNQDAGSSSTA